MGDLHSWPTEAEAAGLLQTSVKTISRYAAQGKLEVRKRARPGKKPENVCNPRDVERLLPAAHVMPEEPRPTVPAASGMHLTRRPNPHTADAAAFFSLIQTIATAIQTERPDVQKPKLWLSLEEAAELSGLSESTLRNCIHYKQVVGIRGGPHGAWRIQRASLEAFAG